MMDILGSRGAIEEMEEVYQKLKQSGQQPNVSVFLTMLKHLTIAGDSLTRIIKVLHEMHEHNLRIDLAFQNLIEALQKRDMWAQCHQLFVELREKEIKLGPKFDWFRALRCMMPYWAKNIDMHGLCIGCILEAEPKQALDLFNELIAELAKLGQIDTCNNVVRVMRHHKLTPNVDTYCELFHAAATAKLSSIDDYLLEQMLDDEVTEPDPKVK
jgi:hypothetical protein